MPDKFTPGPWLHKFNAREYERAVYAGHYQIAAVYGTRDSASPADEAKANAKLIAAAPDLHEALNAILGETALYTWANEKGIGIDEFERRGAVIRKAQTALRIAQADL